MRRDGGEGPGVPEANEIDVGGGRDKEEQDGGRRAAH